MDSCEQQWIDGKMITDGLINAWMNAMEKWMMDELMMNDEGMRFKNKGSNPCLAGHAYLKSLFSHVICHFTEGFRKQPWDEWDGQ